MSLRIESLDAYEILDSRGTPTLAVRARLSGGAQATAHVPSGASTGRHEALELRDGDLGRYGGRGVLRAARNIGDVIAPALQGVDVRDLPAVDRHLIALDGTPQKSRLGANATLGVSCVLARALSVAEGRPLWRTLRESYGIARAASLPVPMVNILSGGLHAGGNIDLQDFLVTPRSAATYSEALHGIVAIHRAAREEIAAEGFALTGVADEGGWGPALPSNETALEILTRAIERAGYRAGDDYAVALDVAASHFYSDGNYRLRSEGRTLTPPEMVDLLERWCARYPVVSIEDGLDQDDWASWPQLCARLGASVQLIGDDLFTTNAQRLRRGIGERSANAVLVKMNQIGTLLETFEVVSIALEAGFRAVVSARSGETEDSFLADLAVASGAGQIKVGSITRSERLAKYNRLLELERYEALEYAGTAAALTTNSSPNRT